MLFAAVPIDSFNKSLIDSNRLNFMLLPKDKMETVFTAFRLRVILLKSTSSQMVSKKKLI